jgi:predicted CXXCH cytochrome family protein
VSSSEKRRTPRSAASPAKRKRAPKKGGAATKADAPLQADAPTQPDTQADAPTQPDALIEPDASGTEGPTRPDAEAQPAAEAQPDAPAETDAVQPAAEAQPDAPVQAAAAQSAAPPPLEAASAEPSPGLPERAKRVAARSKATVARWIGTARASRWHPLAIAAVAALIVVVATLALWPPAAPRSAAEARFVGSAACAACHRVEHDAWQRSQHARAMQPASEATVRAKFDGAKLRYAGVESTFVRRDGRYFVRTDGRDGKLDDFEVKYTFGVDPLQQYLIELPGGKLQALSLAWDARPKASGGERWFHLYPLDKINHRDELHWTRRAQSWNFMCADCHSTNVRKGYDAANDTYRSAWSEIAVGCESCHGPGSLHVEWAQRGRDDAAKGLTVALDERARARWTIDAATGTATRSVERRSDTEIETCAPCHSRRAQLAEGWRAGLRFLDFYRPAPLAPPLYHADGQQHEQVFEWGTFVQSRMYRLGVTCGDCHEPHGGGLRASGDALCAQCHLATKYAAREHHHHGGGVRCVDCHMPATTFMVVDARRDHGIRVPRPDLSIALGTPNACAGCHRQKSAQWADEALRGWYGRRAQGLQRYAGAFAYAERGAAEAGRTLAAVARDLSQPPFARASALEALARFPSAQATEVAKRATGDADPLVRHASIAALASAPAAERWSSLAPLLADALRVNRVDAAAALADVPNASSDAAFQRAAAEYEAAMRYGADRPESRIALGTFYARLRRVGEADAAFRGALALDPSYAPTYVAFADAFRLQDRDADAARVLREGLARAPDDASLHHALGLALVRMKRESEGLRELSRATQLAPANAHLAYVYAVALNAHGRTSAAVREIDRALARHPDERELLGAAVRFRRDAGDAAGAARFARRFAERYPDDPQAATLAAPAAAR